MTARRLAITAADCYAADAPMPGDLDAPSAAEHAGWPLAQEYDEQADDLPFGEDDEPLDEDEEDEEDEDDDIAPYERTPLEDRGDELYEQERDR